MVSFAAAPLPLPAGATLNALTGAFSFTPDESQVGAIALTFIASDGVLSDSESVTITVVGAPAGGITALAGRLLDANDAALGVETPIVGAGVTLLGSGVTPVLSDANGEFTLSGLPAGEQVLDIDSGSAQPAPNGAAYASFREELTLISAVTNQLERPIFLPRIDPAGTVQVVAGEEAVVANPDLGITLTVAADTAFLNGQPFLGQLSISAVPLEFAPMALPEELGFAQLISIQPTGVTFSQPALITFPNTSTTELDRFGAATGITDALLRVTTTERDTNGKARRRVAANGRVDEMIYDALGNLLSLTEAAGDPLERTTSFEYEPVFNQATMITDPLGSPTTFAYDANGNLTTITDAALTRTVMAYADVNCPGLVTSVTRAVGLAEETATTLAYDPVTCNLTTTTDDLGNATSFGYDSTGNLITATDALLRESRFVYDDLNRLVKSIDATNSDPAPACGTAGVTCFSYDAAGNRTDVAGANGQVTSFEYDERERSTSRTDPLLNAETFSYDGNGNLRFATDRKGQVVEFQYDLASRLIKQIMQPGEPEEVVRAVAYDLVDNVTSVVDPDSSLAFTYDLLNRVETASTAGSPFQPAVVLTATYDKNDNRLTLDDPVGQSVFVYDALNRLTDLATPSLPAQPILYGYDPLSRRTDVTLPNGVETSLVFDTASRLTDISHVQGGATTVSRFAYGHDAVNNRTSLTQTRSSVTVNAALTYGYDDLDRLTQATNPQLAAPDETFGYDPVGNRLNRDGQVVDSVFDAANRLIEDADFTYAYDLNGNLTSKTAKVGGAVTAYIWDAEDRLVRIDLPGGGVAQSRYDVQGRRIEKDVNGTITRYVYDGSAILLEYDGLNTLLARYTHGPDIDDPLMLERDQDTSGSFDLGERFFYQTDGLGSVTELTDNTGAVARALVYDSYGRIAQDTGGVGQPFAFTGRELDSESGLYFYRARYYDAETGRFLSQDPIGFNAGDLNLYRYVGNNPVNLKDPSGLESIADDTFGARPDPVLEACFRGCLADQLGIPEALMGAGAAPIPKKALGLPRAFGSSPFTNPISAMNRKMRIPGGARVLGTRRLLGALGRANIVTFGGLLAVDLVESLICAERCKNDQQCPVGGG